MLNIFCQSRLGRLESGPDAANGRIPAVTGLFLKLVVGALLMAPLLWTKPAAAALPGIELISAESASNSTNFKNATATCPPGKKLFGTSAQITIDSGGSEGQVLVQSLIPNSTLTSVLAEAFEIGSGITGNWRVFAFAVCATPVATMQRVVSTVAPSVGTFKGAQAVCPAGLSTYGGGYSSANATGEVFPFFYSPNVNLTSITVQGMVDQALPEAWGLTAYAICGTQRPGMAYTANGSVIDANSPKTQSVSCPAGNKVSTGHWHYGQDDAQRGNIVVTRASMTAALASMQIKAAENDAVATNWSVNAITICVP